jgi:hypothetical protein
MDVLRDSIVTCGGTPLTIALKERGIARWVREGGRLEILKKGGREEDRRVRWVREGGRWVRG